jgi:hypothetical protein
MAQEMLSFEDMSTDESGSEIQKRKQALQTSAQEFTGQAQKVSEESEQTLRSQYALREMRDQTANMKQAMKYQRSNFDEGLKQQRSLSAIDASAKTELFDKEIQFKRDAQGRKILSERQLADWMIQKQATEEDFKNFEQRTSQLHQRKIQLLQAAYAKIEQAEKQAYQLGKGALDKETTLAITEKKRALDEKIRKAKQKAANRSSIITGAFTVAGAVVGGVVGGMAGGVGAAPGAAVGASAGSGLGQAVSGATS